MTKGFHPRVRVVAGERAPFDVNSPNRSPNCESIPSELRACCLLETCPHAVKPDRCIRTPMSPLIVSGCGRFRLTAKKRVLGLHEQVSFREFVTRTSVGRGVICGAVYRGKT